MTDHPNTRPDLLPCPNGIEAELMEDINMSGKGQFWVQSDSGWVGPVKSEPDDAVDAWNTRAVLSNTRPDRETIAKLRSALDDCVTWMWEREKMIPGLERLCDRGRKVLSETDDAVLSFMPEAGWRDGADWKRFGQALVEDWPTGDIDGSFLFDMCLKYNVIREIPGGFDPDQHIDAEGICPEPGDPWYEYVPECAPTPAPDPVEAAAAETILKEARKILNERHAAILRDETTQELDTGELNASDETFRALEEIEDMLRALQEDK